MSSERASAGGESNEKREKRVDNQICLLTTILLIDNCSLFIDMPKGKRYLTLSGMGYSF